MEFITVISFLQTSPEHQLSGNSQLLLSTSSILNNMHPTSCLGPQIHTEM